jgi:hypothetical protein
VHHAALGGLDVEGAGDQVGDPLGNRRLLVCCRVGFLQFRPLGEFQRIHDPAGHGGALENLHLGLQVGGTLGGRHVGGGPVPQRLGFPLLDDHRRRRLIRLGHQQRDGGGGDQRRAQGEGKQAEAGPQHQEEE